MRIDSSRGISVAPEFRARNRDPKPEPLAPANSLVPLETTVNARSARPVRTLAAYVAQLIAREQHAGHMRVRNRAEPAEAAEAYQKMLNLSGTPKRYKARPF
jgi:hypothetical protein